jgi:hypothetical protein
VRLRRSTTTREVDPRVFSSLILIFQRSHQVSIELRPRWSFLITRVVLYSFRADCTENPVPLLVNTNHRENVSCGSYCCVRNIMLRTSHVTPSQYCWSMTSCARVEVCLLSRNIETDCVTLLFHCWYVYYLETADSVA